MISALRLFAMLLLACPLLACERSQDFDRDGFSEAEGDCDDGDPLVNPGASDFPGDGLDTNCDGTDLASTSLADLSLGTVYSETKNHTFGYNVTCGPDVDGNGVGDLAFNAETFVGVGVDTPQGAAAVYRTNEPVSGEVLESEIDGWIIQEGEAAGSTIGFRAALVAAPLTPGLLFSATSEDAFGEERPLAEGRVLARFATTDASFGPDVSNLFRQERHLLVNPHVAPDLTGDGRPDLVLGASGEGVTIWPDAPVGAVWTDEAPIQLRIHGGPGFFSLDSGDLNGDGSTDLALANETNSSRPDVDVVFGPILEGTWVGTPKTSFRVWGATELGVIASSVRVAIGDFTGDGVGDLAVGAHTANGRDGGLWVFFGPLQPGDYGFDSDADARFLAESPGSWLGTAVVAADLDGSGVDALVVGASMDADYGAVPRAGLVYVMKTPLRAGDLGPSDVRMVLRGDQLADNAGWSIASCDTNKNGRDELMIGAPDHDFDKDTRDAGRVYWVGEMP